MDVRIALIVLAASLPLSCSRADGRSQEAIIAEMHQLLGRDAKACGLAETLASAEAGWRCAVERDLKGQAFWFAVGGTHTDSEIWHIIARTKSNDRFVFFFTSNRNGQPTFDPQFTRHKCNEPFRFFPDELFTLRCGTDVP